MMMRLDSLRSNPRMALLAGSAVVAAALVAALAVGWNPFSQGQPTATDASAPSAPSAPRRDLSWLQKAMDDCEEQAKREPESVVFLVIPLLPADNDYSRWDRRAIS